ncbi:MAG: ATP-binding protein [Acidimicrobiales bacterium]
MTRRLVLSYLAITVVVLVVLEVPLGWFYAQREDDRYIAAAERDAIVLANFYEDALEDVDVPDPSAAEAYAARVGARVVVVGPDGISVLDTAAEAPRDFSTRPEVASALAGERSGGIRRSDTLDDDLVFVAIPVSSGGTVHGALRLTVSADEVTARVRLFWWALAAVAAVVLVAVTVIGFVIARSVTRPITTLQRSARRFADGDLSGVDLDDDAPAEVAELGEAMNSMARRLDDMISGQRAFVGDASHQLRTPLTALRLRLENLEAAQRDPAATADAEAAIAEVDRLHELVEGLLVLARADREPELEAVDVADIARQRVDTWSAVADDVGVHLALDLPDRAVSAVATAVKGAVEQVIGNLLDNALAVAPSGSTITVGVVVAGGRVRLSVADEGPGLDDEEKAKATERFWRGDDRPRGGVGRPHGGTGLGLAIAQRLAEAGGGSLELADNPGGGLVVTLELSAGPPA